MVFHRRTVNRTVKKRKVPDLIKKYVTKKVKHVGEVKSIYNFVASPISMPNTGWGIQVLNSSNTINTAGGQGVGDNMHIGDKIEMVGFHLRAAFSSLADTSSIARVIVYYIKEINETSPIITDYMNYRNSTGEFIYGTWKPEQKKDVKVILDKTFNITNNITGVNKATHLEFNRKFKNALTTLYAPNTASTTSSGILKGGLYLAYTCNNSGAIQFDALNASVDYRDV